jgi:cytoskeletal protein CcmA (bactofilin family)
MAIQVKDLSGKGESTVIGESILVNGKLEGDEDLTVRGRVQGSITLTKTLIVEQSGAVKADATVRNAIVSGVVVGNITASESVHLTKEGRMVGDIAAPRVIIVEGAAFRGHVDMGAVAEPKLGENRPAPRAVTAPSRPVSRPMTPPKPPPPPSPRSESKPPPPPPPPLPPKPAVAAAHEALEASGPVPVALGKKKVVVKRRK